VAREIQGRSVELGSGCPAKAPGMKDVAETVMVMLSNPSVACVVVDRQAGPGALRAGVQHELERAPGPGGEPGELDQGARGRRAGGGKGGCA
jgi:hypothetical protein